MILVNLLGFYDAVPSCFKHAEGTGLTFADWVAPLFLFVLGVLYRQSLVRRISADGRRGAYLHVLRRYSLLGLIGLAGGAVSKMRITLDWGVLQSIGLAGIVALPFVELGSRSRLLVGLAILAVYQVALPSQVHDVISSAEHGGVLGVVSWAALILFATVAGDLFSPSDFKSSLKRIGLFGLAMTAGGLFLAIWVPVNKHAVSPSYVLVTTGLSASVFVGFLGLVDGLGVSVPTWNVLGRNALLVFLAHYVLVKSVHAALTEEAGLAWVMCSAALVYVSSYVLALFFHRQRIYFKL